MAQSSISLTIEPYRKGNSFADWIERLGYFFEVNGVQDEMKKAHLITLSGQTVFTELKLLFPNGALTAASYDDMVTRLKSRFDKTETDIIQRFKFNNRVQQPDESIEDFILSIKLQAEFCNFSDFKESAIRDRIVAGVRDQLLRQRLFNEDNLTLVTAEKICTTWEMAGTNARRLQEGGNAAQIASIQSPNGQVLAKLAAVYRFHNSDQAGSSRGPVKSRLGYNRSNVGAQSGRGTYGRRGQGNNRNSTNVRPVEWRRNQNRDPNDLVCDFCGIRGHIKRKCFRLRNMRRDAVHLVEEADEEELGEPSQDLCERLQYLRTDDDDNDNSGTAWKRGHYGPPEPAADH